MHVELLRILQVQRDLYAMPRDMKRFRTYIETMTGGSADIVLPISGMNPMGKEHVPAMIDAYLALHAEDAAQRALDEALPRLAHVDLRLKAALVATDDAAGGWTERHQTDHTHRFELAPRLKRGFAIAQLWTSEKPDLAHVGIALREDLYRLAHFARHGAPRTLAEHLAQEGRAMRFAGTPAWPAKVGAAARQALAPHMDATDHPTLFACLYGDEAARTSGHKALGVPAWGGLALAQADAAPHPEREVGAPKR